MAAVVDRVWRTSSAGEIEADLSALWREVGERGPVARAMMSNLVVFRPAESDSREVAIDESPDNPVHAVAAQHPCRAIVIEHRDTESASDQFLSAAVGIVTFGPPGARYGIEQIALRSACPAASLPSIVRRLARGDLPISVWWADDLSRVAPAAPIATMGRQLVYDSRQWRDIRRGVVALAPYVTSREAFTPASNRMATESALVDLADVNWRRLAPVRRALIVVAQGHERADWRPADFRITHGPGDGALAWLLIGWLASRLDWPATAQLRIEPARGGESALTIVVGGGPGETRVTLDGGRVVVARSGSPPSIVGVPHEGEADALAAELHTLAHDACLHDALSALIRLFSAA